MVPLNLTDLRPRSLNIWMKKMEDGREQKEKQLQDNRVAIRCHMLLFERLVSYE